MIQNLRFLKVDGVIFNKKLKPIIENYLTNHKDKALSKVSYQLSGYIRLQNLLGESNPKIEEVIDYLKDYPLNVSALVKLDYTQLTFNYLDDLVYLNQFKYVKPRQKRSESKDHEFLRKIGVLQNGN